MPVPALLGRARRGKSLRGAPPTTGDRDGTLVADGRLRDVWLVRENGGERHRLGVLATPLLKRHDAAPTATASTIPELAQAMR
jgi:hypothetical protein